MSRASQGSARGSPSASSSRVPISDGFPSASSAARRRSGGSASASGVGRLGTGLGGSRSSSSGRGKASSRKSPERSLQGISIPEGMDEEVCCVICVSVICSSNSNRNHSSAGCGAPLYSPSVPPSWLRCTADAGAGSEQRFRAVSEVSTLLTRSREDCFAKKQVYRRTRSHRVKAI